MTTTAELFESAKVRVDYNSHDLGEFGRMIRVQYVHNILDDLLARLSVVVLPGDKEQQ